MRLTLIFLLIHISLIFATTMNAQTTFVNIMANNLEAKNVIDQIEKQTDYLFVYNNTIDLSKRVSMDVSGVSVAEVLSAMFSDTDIVYAMEGNNILL